MERRRSRGRKLPGVEEQGGQGREDTAHESQGGAAVGAVERGTLAHLRNANTEHRQVVKFTGPTPDAPKKYLSRMIERIDTALGRHLYSRRMGIVEPVFANLRHMLGLNRFTLRTKAKVDIQWKLYCMVHNIGKLMRFAPRFQGAG